MPLSIPFEPSSLIGKPNMVLHRQMGEDKRLLQRDEDRTLETLGLGKDNEAAAHCQKIVRHREAAAM